MDSQDRWEWHKLMCAAYMHEGGVPDAWSCLNGVQDGQKWLDFDEITMNIKIDHESLSRRNTSLDDQDMVECVLIGGGINDDSV